MQHYLATCCKDGEKEEPHLEVLENQVELLRNEVGRLRRENKVITVKQSVIFILMLFFYNSYYMTSWPLPPPSRALTGKNSKLIHSLIT